MTMPIKTQCPHCQAIFTLPKSQLNKRDAKGRCGHCEQFFLLNDHIIVTENNKPTDVPPLENTPSAVSEVTQSSTTPSAANIDTPTKISKSETPSQKKPLSKDKTAKKSIDKASDSDLIYDDMEIDEPQDTTLDYGALEDMDAWITQLDSADIESAPVEAAIPYHNIEDTKSKELVSENAWLASLLEDEKAEETAPNQNKTTNAKNNSSLSQLLTDIGIPTQERRKSTENTLTKKPESASGAQKRSLIATFLWFTGSLVLILLLFAQYVIFNLNTLIKNPVYEAYLQDTCALVACRLPSADISQFTVVEVSHSASKVSAGATFSDIKAVLINQSTEAQLLPNLKVSLYEEDALIGEFIALPEDYLISPQEQLAADYPKPVMFTVPIPAKQISEISIDALY